MTDPDLKEKRRKRRKLNSTWNTVLKRFHTKVKSNKEYKAKLREIKEKDILDNEE